MTAVSDLADQTGREGHVVSANQNTGPALVRQWEGRDLHLLLDLKSKQKLVSKASKFKNRATVGDLLEFIPCRQTNKPPQLQGTLRHAAGTGNQIYAILNKLQCFAGPADGVPPGPACAGDPRGRTGYWRP